VKYCLDYPVSEKTIIVDALKVRSVAGCGVEAEVRLDPFYFKECDSDNVSKANLAIDVVRIGSPEWIRTFDEDANMLKKDGHKSYSTSQAVVHCSSLGGVIATIDLVDEIRGSASNMETLRKRFRKVAVLSGDTTSTVKDAARRMGIAEGRGDIVLGGLRPPDKVKALEDLGLLAGKRICAVGDGTNDGPFLAAADLGIAMGRTKSKKVAGVASMSAGVLIPRGGIGLVHEALLIAAKCRFVINFALIWAGMYNFIALLLCSGCLAWFGIFVPAYQAAMAMASSSCLVICCSIGLAWNLELRRRKLQKEEIFLS
jgi:P-type Cu2+ transporter